MKKNFSLFPFQFSPKNGFTLIELLVVIVIISILATLLMVNFIGVRQRGRDAQRKSDLRQIQSALELYRADKGDYPTTAAYNAVTCLNQFADSGAIYINKMPCDPKSGAKYSYNFDGSGAYTLYACLENLNDINKDPSVQTTCNTAGLSSFTVNAP